MDVLANEFRPRNRRFSWIVLLTTGVEEQRINQSNLFVPFVFDSFDPD